MQRFSSVISTAYPLFLGFLKKIIIIHYSAVLGYTRHKRWKGSVRKNTDREKESRWGKQEERGDLRSQKRQNRRMKKTSWEKEVWIGQISYMFFSVSQLLEQLILALKQNWTSGSLVDAQNCLTTHSWNKKHHTFWKWHLGAFLSQMFRLKPRCLSRPSCC